jgi:DNA-binding HxlR family transcriptional regulator
MNEALADALTTIGDRWTLLVIAALLDGPRRFGDLQAEVEGIAPNVLTQRLRQLERNALVVARPYSERPPRFVYELSSAGQELAGALRLIAGWGARHADGATAPPPRGVRHADGGAVVVSDLRARRRGRRGRARVRLTPPRRNFRH